MDALPGQASREGTAAYAAAHPGPDGHYRERLGWTLSSVGLGSYLGTTDEAACQAYEEAALVALESGVNVLDTAANYRDQRSERDLGAALRRFVQRGGTREQVVVSTKAGLLHGDADSDLGSDWFQKEYVLDGTVRRQDVVDQIHCMTPRYLEAELTRSLRNLGLATVDVFYLHNPESQLAGGVPQEDFYARIQDAFEALERQADAGRIGVYGVATWDGLRVPADHPAHVSLVKLVHAAGEAAVAVRGDARTHRFRAVQMPLNLAMPEALVAPTQPWRLQDHVSALAAADELGMLIHASASLMQAKLVGRVPAEWKEAFGTQDDLATCLQFTRSCPGVTSALVGMGRPEHARQDVGWAMERGPDEAALGSVLEASPQAQEQE